jgi:hypothetical protein
VGDEPMNLIESIPNAKDGVLAILWTMDNVINGFDSKSGSSKVITELYDWIWKLNTEFNIPVSDLLPISLLVQSKLLGLINPIDEITHPMLRYEHRRLERSIVDDELKQHIITIS